MTPARHGAETSRPSELPASPVNPSRHRKPLIRIAVAGLFAAHGLIHLLGFADAFSFVDLPQLTTQVPPAAGLWWLTAGLLCCAAASALFLTPRWWWVVGAAAVLMSQAAIATAWSDAGVGTAANAVLLVAVLYGFASRGPWSLRAEYERALATCWPEQLAGPVTEADLAPLPDPVRRYLRRAGVVGQPRVLNFRATFTGRIRSSPDADWMTFTADQFNTVDPPRRFFLMDARMKGLPVEVLHAFDEDAATMRVRLLSIRSMVNAKGPTLTRAETVTVLNDLCVLAPSSLTGPRVTWDPVDASTAVAHFTLGINTIAAELHFDRDGDLVDFVSDDRAATSPNGKTLTSHRWSTPVRNHTQFGPVRVPREANVKWHPPTGSWTYGEFELTTLTYNVTHPEHHEAQVNSDPTVPTTPRAQIVIR